MNTSQKNMDICSVDALDISTDIADFSNVELSLCQIYLVNLVRPRLDLTY